MSSGELYKQHTPVHPFSYFPQLGKLGHSFAGQNSGDDHEERVQFQRHRSGRGKQAKNHCHSQKKAMENGSVICMTEDTPR